MKSGILLVAVACVGSMLCAGCGSLSLFSDRHVHYHGSDKVDEKVTNLEKRLEAIEKANQSK